MGMLERIKGLLIDPEGEWALIEAQRPSVLDIYRSYVLPLALIPPFASFLGGYFFGFGRPTLEVAHLTFWGGLLRAGLQYALSLPLLFLIAFLLSSLAPHFDGKSDDRRAMALTAFSYTPVWLASLFGLVPGLRWLDILGLYGIYVFYHGVTRMLRCPKDNVDVLTLVALAAAIAAATLHGWLVHLLAPWRAVAL
ncbi:Yip1 family protein [Methylocystis bryophila]|uniref:YIP1 family protein n=1 Tax=Methylocystis bryophila TaxID=655015 RepID=A0A1W6MUW1_9HYPH|nr:Yip1 family protein [Methylocystis bryophila]ARN81390.1 YIP1 family protein [Methylocystis bryophila]BDV37383.1 hypothetical protein DSM21852_06360 [Methylocystis bryophila]